MTPEELERRFPGWRGHERPDMLYPYKDVRARVLWQVAAELQKMHMDAGWSNIRGAASVALLKLIVDLGGVPE